MTTSQHKIKVGDTVYVFNGENIYPGTLVKGRGKLSKIDLEHSPSLVAGTTARKVFFNFCLGLDPGPFKFAEQWIFSSYPEAAEAMEAYFEANPHEREKVKQLHERNMQYLVSPGLVPN